MDKQKNTTRVIDWTDRKEAMATYRKYEELRCTGPNYQYYNSKLLPAPVSPVMITPPTSYQVESERDGNED